MKGLLAILGLSLMAILVTNPVYAMEMISGGSSVEIKSMNTPFGTLQYRALYVDADAPVPVGPGGDNDGVGKFLFTPVSGGNFICSAALLAESTEVPVVLTAAHCVTDEFGVFNLATGSVTFNSDCGDQVIGVEEAWTQFHPDWMGEDTGLFFGNDIALIELENFPADCPSGDNVDRYFIDRSLAGDLGLMPENIGFGNIGVGATGAIPFSNGFKHSGTNTYDEGDSWFIAIGLPPGPLYTAGSQLVTDFDNGLALNDAHAFVGLTVDPIGKGLDEALSAGGDSGGPHFNGAKEITAVTSWGATFGLVPDVDDALNSSFGEVAGDTRVATYASWIDESIALLEAHKAPPQQPTVAGELIGIDTTAILLAGAQMNAIWILPLIVAAAAIGIVVSRKF